MGTIYHESSADLSTESQEMHRALASLIEELEAVDWYQQRADVTGDDDLKAILIHNMNEEIEHATMTLEWIRRRNPEFDKVLRTYLFTNAPITEIEEHETSGGGEATPAPVPISSSLNIGKFRKGE